MSSTMSSHGIPSQDQALESATKFGIEDCINNGVHKRIHIANPSGIKEDVESDLALF